MKYNAKIIIAAMADFGIPRPELELVFHPERKWRFDFAFPKAKLAVEVDGGVWIQGRHTRGSGFVKDMEKYNAATILGWRILRFQPQDLTKLATLAAIKLSLNQ